MSDFFSVRKVSKNFDGVKALSNFSLSIDAGEILGIFGPNGAGKTTFFNVSTGYILPDDGCVVFRSKNITARDPFQIANLGITRTFQTVRLINHATVLENVLLFSKNNPGESLLNLFVRPSSCSSAEISAKQKCLDLLAELNLKEWAGEKAGNLSYGQRKLLTIVCCLASDAPLLLFDEPVAGVAPNMATVIMDIIRNLPEQGKTVILIEHNMEILRELCMRLIFMSAGRKICEGPPDEVMNNPQVLSAYVGS